MPPVPSDEPTLVLARPDPVLLSPTTEEIAAQAYAKFEARGGQHGHDLDDWLNAERALLSELAEQLAEAVALREDDPSVASES